MSVQSKYFYMDEGKMVLTEQFLKDRGYCCGQKCCHCPYWPKYQYSNTKLKEDELYKHKTT